MIEVGQSVFPDYFPPQSVVFGDSLGLLGPSMAKWVLMGHESLVTRYLSVTSGASITFLTLDGAEAKTTIQVTTANGIFIVATEAQARNYGGLIDDVSLRQMVASGALVKQWQQ